MQTIIYILAYFKKNLTKLDDHVWRYASGLSNIDGEYPHQRKNWSNSRFSCFGNYWEVEKKRT